MIVVDRLCKRYGNISAVADISFSAAKGEIVGFLGPNGAGKTTTIRMLATYLPPSSGTAQIAGYDILTQAEEVRRRIGYLPENPPLYGEMTVAEYLTFVAQIKGVIPADIKERVGQALEVCFLTGVRHRLCSHLSKGYRQRVGLAQAIIHNPEVIILDEPTSGLDPKQIVEIRKLIASLAEHHTVILSTHILPEVTAVCNRVVIISRGKIVLEDSLQALVRGKTLEQVFMDCVTGDDTRSDAEQISSTNGNIQMA